MSTTRLAVIAIMCSGCQPADIIINYYGETAGESESDGSESDGEPVPDLPPDMPAETETGDGDGDGDPGDGDGDMPDLGALIVESAGERIGYLLDVWEYGYIVWDDVNDLTYKISALTGNIAAEGAQTPPLYIFHTMPDCVGTRYLPAKSANTMECDDVPAQSVRTTNVVGGSTSGHIAADYIEVTFSSPYVISPQSIQHLNGSCQSNMTATCAFQLMATDVIPVTFPLPITVAESVSP
jgi:hypothetical protein